MLHSQNIALRLTDVIAKIEKCRQKHDITRPVNLLAVSKKHPESALREAYLAGQKTFGESYISEAVPKIQALSDCNIEWHFIGPIQSNKTKQIAETFDWVESVDRAKVIKRLNEQRTEALPPLNVCLQVNAFEESAKSGANLVELEELARLVSQSNRLIFRGIMAIPPKEENPEKQLKNFNRIASIFEQLKNQYQTVDTLSIGMSGDLEAAIIAGSTQVRIGTAIFGLR